MKKVFLHNRTFENPQSFLGKKILQMNVSTDVLKSYLQFAEIFWPYPSLSWSKSAHKIT